MAKSLHTPEYAYFRALLIAAREQADLTQTDVALRLGCPQSFISKYENGERRLDIVEFVKICSALGIQPQSIVADVESWIRERTNKQN